MLKKVLFAVAPMVLVAGSVTANDELLSAVAKLDMSGVETAAADVEDETLLGQADVDALMSDGEESDDDAIAACFRRMRGGFGGYRGYGGFRSYGYSYRSYHRPVYRNYHCYTPVVRHYTPVTYSYCTPIYNSYWGCW